MSDVNIVVVIGRLTREPDLKFTKDGKAICTFSLAVNGYKENDVNYIDVEVWEKAAENMAKFVHKGSQVCIEGALKQERWEKDGVKRSTLKIRANKVQFLDTKKSSSQEKADNSEYYKNQDGRYHEENSNDNVPY